jgi:signal transduction histidine kinase
MAVNGTRSDQAVRNGEYRLPADATRDLDALNDGLRAVAEGERDLTIETSPSGSIAAVASTANAMIQALIEAEGQCGLAWSDHRELMAGISHDLRTPIASLRVLAEAIDDEHDPEETRRYMKGLLGHLHSLEVLIEDIFELSRLTAGQRSWSLRRVRLEDLLTESVEAMEGQAARQGIVLRVRQSEVLPAARANPEKVQRVLFNLIENAIRHTPAKGTITVCAEASGGYVETEVSNSGHRLESAESERLFERFHQGEPASERVHGGAGLGLSICRAIIEAHGGQIWFVDSEVDTRVRFSLPVSSSSGTTRVKR